MSASASVASGPKFSSVEETLYGLLPLNRDVSITVLYEAVAGPNEAVASVTFRQQQQAVGKYISRINAKIITRRETIAPGVGRRTYRLRKMRDK